MSLRILWSCLFVCLVAVGLPLKSYAQLQPAYYVAEFTVTDPEGIKPYSARVESTFLPYGGRFIVRGGEIVALEGTAPSMRRVVIAFPSIEKARAWYNSADYVELRKIRYKSAFANVYLVMGVIAE